MITVLPDIPGQPPNKAAFFVAGEDIFLAVGYRNHPILLWDAVNLHFIGQCNSVAIGRINDMVFNPNPEIVALVVSYGDGSLCIFDYTTTRLDLSRPKQCAESLACSPDGRSLVTGSSRGVIDLFEFDQDKFGSTILTHMYRINATEDLIRGIAFTSDGLRFGDIRGSQCRIWAPTLLVRKEDELQSTSDAISFHIKTLGVHDEPKVPEISSPIRAATQREYVVAGKMDGNVTLYSTTEGKEIANLYQHASGVAVIDVALGEISGLIASADESGRILVVKEALSLFDCTQQREEHEVQPVQFVLDRRFRTAVQRLTINTAGNRLLISGRGVEELWELPSGRIVGMWPILDVDQELSSTINQINLRNNVQKTADITHTAISHPTNDEWFIILAGDRARIFEWNGFRELTPTNGIKLGRSPPRSNADHRDMASVKADDAKRLSSTASYHVGPEILVELVRPSPLSGSILNVWPTALLNPFTKGEIQPVETSLKGIDFAILDVLGISGTSTIVFLDVNLWVCSFDILLPDAVTATANLNAGGLPPSWQNSRLSTPAGLQHRTSLIRRHFFALSEWRTSEGTLRSTLAASRGASGPQGVNRDIVFANGSGIVAVKDGMEFSENIVLDSAALSRHENGQVTVRGQRLWTPVSGSMHRRTPNR
jgi:WD40 repeat protein